MEAEGNRLARGLLLDDTLDVDDVFETVDGGDLAFATLLRASDNQNFIVFADWDGADLEGVRYIERRSRGDEHCTCREVPCSKARS